MIDKEDIRALIRVIALSLTNDEDKVDEVVDWAYRGLEREPKKNKPANKVLHEDVEKIYALYPTKCPVSGRGTGKSSKDKTRIIALLKTHTVEGLEAVINQYLSDCSRTNTYIKNFSTFLNNIPDYPSDATPGSNAVAPQFSQRQESSVSDFNLASGGFDF